MLGNLIEFIFGTWYWVCGVGVLLVLVVPSFRIIKQNQVGLVVKRFGLKKLKGDNPVAFKGEPGYQANLLMPGVRWKFWIVCSVRTHPWVQVPPGEIGVVIAQIGKTLPVGAKTAVYREAFGSYTDLDAFLEHGGEKGVQRHVLPPGTLAPIHPVAFIVITASQSYGVPVSEALVTKAFGGRLVPESFGKDAESFKVLRIEPEEPVIGDEKVDVIGIITTFEGDPLPAGAIASRLGNFEDIEELEQDKNTTDAQLVETVLSHKNKMHNNYQNFQAFLDNGGRIGLQHDPLLYGAYNLNPFLVSVQRVPMLVIEQGQVAVIKSYVGLGTVDTSGEEFKFGSLVKPGHRGIWQEALRTGKYPINPHCYEAVIVPTYILTLNWAEAQSAAHKLDSRLQQIDAKSIEGFEFKLDLQVQIHIPDTKAPHVISMVGTIVNLVDEVLQAAVGNHFRDKLQSLKAVAFIERRQEVQEDAFEHIRGKLDEYQVETKGVYIQDVIFPPRLVAVLTEREVAHQEIETFQKQKEAEDQRVETEKSKGTADMQAELAKSSVGVAINENNAKARIAEANGEATYIRETGQAKSAEVEAVGMARAKAYKAQVAALGQGATAAVNVATVLSEKGMKIVPDVLVAGGGGSIEGLAATLTNMFRSGGTDASVSSGAREADGPNEADSVVTEPEAVRLEVPGIESVEDASSAEEELPEPQSDDSSEEAE